jgi:hypothetical protein
MANEFTPMLSSDNISRYVKQHKEIIESVKGGKDVLDSYFTTLYGPLNYTLRNGEYPPAKWYAESGKVPVTQTDILEGMETMDAIFSKIEPLQAPILLYRGVAIDDIREYKKALQFHSTTFNPNYAQAAVSMRGKTCCLLKITVLPETKVLFTGNTQDEVIINRDVVVKLYSFHNVVDGLYNACTESEQKEEEEEEKKVYKNNTLETVAESIYMDMIDNTALNDLMDEKNIPHHMRDDILEGIDEDDETDDIEAKLLSNINKIS